MRNESRLRLRLLLLEDNPADAELVIYQLRRAGIDAEAVRVVTREDFEARLNPCPDAILSDYRLPLWSGLEALQLVRGRGLDVPFLIVSGTIGEDLAVEAMRHGADDYLLKDRLSRLGGALTQALERKRLREETRKVADALREREAELRQAQQIAKLAHAVSKPDGSFESWSETLPALIAMESSRLPKSTREWLTLLHADDRAMFRNKSIEAGKNRTRVDMEYRLRRGDGAWIHIRHLIEPLQEQADAAGRTRWFNTVQDVTAQKRAEEELRESELRFRQLAENIREVFFLVDGANSRMLYVSPAYEHVWGRSCESLYAQPQSWFEAIHPDDRARVLADFERMRSTGQFECEFRVACPDGTLRSIHARGFPIRDDAGNLSRVAGIAADITERKQAQEKIEHLYRVYVVLSGINALILRERNREALFQEACRLAVEGGKFKLAWVGVVEREAKRIKPVAWHGVGREYMDLMPLELDETGPAFGLSGRAVAARRAMITQDMTTDPRVRLGKEALQRGFRSLAILPLTVSGEVSAVLALYAGEVGFFNDEEVKLLLELAGDLSFALEHIENQEKLNYLAWYDSLTGLANRSLFLERLTQFAHAAGPAGERVALVLVDIERLRTINESLGRHAGDAVIKQLAARLARGADPAEVARISADEFAVVLRALKGRAELSRRVERMFADCLGEPFAVGEEALRIAAKGGIALFPNDGVDAETLLRNAEAALRKAKELGERYLVYTSALTERTAERLTLENRLRQALEKEEFVLHYQPKVDLESRRIVAVEALIRWQNPELGLVPPGKFVPLMEETGLILEAGTWALRRASLDHRRWTEQGLIAPRVAVNVSPIQLRQRDFVGVVEQAIIDGLAPTGIDLEITESLVMEDVQGNIAKLKSVRGLGVNIAIDDFGTGYSSLGYLAKLPVQALKIDRSFIITMLEDPDAMTLVQTIISLAHSLRLKVVAEGVDSEEQAKVLRLLRCDEMQGYLFSRPVPFDEMTVLLKQASKA